MRYLKQIQTLKELKQEMHRRNIPEAVIVIGSEELGEYFDVDGELFSDVEIIEKIRLWESWDVAVIIDDWENREIDTEKGEVLYFPTSEDKYDYIRVEKGLEPMYGTPETPYTLISKEEWLNLIGI